MSVSTRHSNLKQSAQQKPFLLVLKKKKYRLTVNREFVENSKIVLKMIVQGIPLRTDAMGISEDKSRKIWQYSNVNVLKHFQNGSTSHYTGYTICSESSKITCTFPKFYVF